MKRSIGVMMGESGAHVGALYHDAVGGRERSAFAYTDAWLAAQVQRDGRRRQAGDRQISECPR